MQFWDENKIVAGQLVACEQNRNVSFGVPNIIGFDLGNSDTTLTALTDGMTQVFETKQALADHLNKYEYLPVSKVIHEGLTTPQLPEDRIGLPVVLIQNVTR